MGFVSFQCHGCPHPLLNFHDGQVHAGNQWMRIGVAIRPDGTMIEGVYDGYAGLIEHETDVEQNIYTDDDDYNGVIATIWHHACWMAAGSPRDYRGRSESADDQGWFYAKGDHDMDEPEPEMAILEPTTLMIDGEDDRWAFVEQDNGTWKLFERSNDDDRIWRSVAGAHTATYEEIIGERDERVRAEADA